MIRWTTPTLDVKIPDVAFDYLILTLKSGSGEINKEIQSSDVADGKFSVTLSQKESSMFAAGTYVDAQINFIDGENRLATNRQSLYVAENLLNKEI